MLWLHSFSFNYELSKCLQLPKDSSLQYSKIAVSLPPSLRNYKTTRMLFNCFHTRFPNIHGYIIVLQSFDKSVKWHWFCGYLLVHCSRVKTCEMCTAGCPLKSLFVWQRLRSHSILLIISERLKIPSNWSLTWLQKMEWRCRITNSKTWNSKARPTKILKTLVWSLDSLWFSM